MLHPVRAMLAALVVLVAACAGQTGAQPEAQFTNDEAELKTDAGYVTLHWSAADSATEYQLQYDTDEGFGAPEARYGGPASQSFISGLEQGEHFYRVRARESADAPWGPWSAPARVTVKHHSMRLAWGLFAAGGLLFVSIAAFVIYHAARTPEPGEEVA